MPYKLRQGPHPPGGGVNYGFGERRKVDYIDVAVFGPTAENAARFLSEGAEVLIAGRRSSVRLERPTARRSRRYGINLNAAGSSVFDGVARVALAVVAGVRASGG